MIIGISGKAGSGKDTVADFLVKNHSFVKVSLADPLKRICMDVFGFSYAQLWGPSEMRNAPDKRYLRDNKFIYPAAPEGALWFPVSGGRTLINEADLDLVLQHKWCVNKKEAGKRTNYVRTWDSSLKLHQLLMGPAPEGYVIDHINGDGMDNRRENLRFCTHAENHANEGKRRGGSSPFKGVGFDKERNKWSTKLTVGGETRNLGRFESEEAAAMAYDKAAVEAFGKHARTNAEMFLTPRYALQQLGTNWGRNCYPNIWIEYGLRVAKRLEDRVTFGDRLGDPMGYLPELGLVPLHEHPSLNDDISGTVFADIRFKNEVAEFKKAGAKLIRIVRGGAGLSGAAAQHASEAEQDQIPDTEFDAVIHNEGTLEDLRLQVESVLRMLMTSAQEEKNSEDLFRFLDGKEVIVTSMSVTYPEGSSIVQEEIPMELESITPLHAASGTLAELLKKREEDVKAGKLMEYDESQKDIPPFKRTKKP